jgi:hypothetical protein
MKKNKCMIYCYGTGEEIETDKGHQRVDRFGGFNNDIIRIYISGCHNKQVGGRWNELGRILFPDLDKAAENFVTAFDDNGELHLDILQRNFGNDVFIVNETGNTTIKPEELSLSGHSRGASLCFLFAQALDLKGITIPVDIDGSIEHVTGNLSVWRNSIARRVIDCSKLKNIRSCTSLVGSYLDDINIQHDNYFKQLVPTIPKEVKHKKIRIPARHHWDAGAEEISKLRLSLTYIKKGYIDEKYKADIRDTLKKYYADPDRFNFIFCENRQEIFGDTSGIIDDPLLKKVVCQCAEEILPFFGVDSTLDLNRAAAVINLHQATFTSNKNCINELRGKFIEKLMKPEFNSEFDHYFDHYCKVINRISGVCNEICFRMENDCILGGPREKLKKICQSFADYKYCLFEQVFQLATVNDYKDPNKAKTDALRNIKVATKKVIKESLDQDRYAWARLLLWGIVNAITHLTFVGMIANGVHKHKTGNWMFFKHTTSANMLRRYVKAKDLALELVG